MRKAILFFAATVAFLFAIPISAQAQKPATWKGGTPGNVSDWNCAANWEEGRVPNAFSDVLIPDVSTASNDFPVVSCPVEGVNTLTLLSGAQLLIKRGGRLEIYVDLSSHGVCKLQNLGTLIAPSLRTDPCKQSRYLSADQ